MIRKISTFLLVLLMCIEMSMGNFMIIAENKEVTYASIFYNAGKLYKVSPIYLATLALQEQGTRGTSAITGEEFSYTFTENGESVTKTYSSLYNFYNIGATTGSDNWKKGLIYANGGVYGSYTSYGRPWNTIEKSICGGAQWISEEYISLGQDTIYSKKFNYVKNSEGNYEFYHQYQTNIRAAYSESYTIYSVYNESGCLESDLTFLIPVYENMPDQNTYPTKYKSNNSIEIEEGKKYVQVLRDSVRVRTEPDTSSTNTILQYDNEYQYYVLNEVMEVVDEKVIGNYIWYNVKKYINDEEFNTWIRNDFIYVMEYEYDQDFEDYLVEQNFPESYLPYLRCLHNIHPTWIFLAYQTELDWNTMVQEENYASGNSVRSLVSGSNEYLRNKDEGYYNSSTNQYRQFEGGGWYRASVEAIQFFMDPRNFINEEDIFMFLKLSFNENETEEKIQLVLNNSFMSGSITTEVDNPTQPDTPETPVDPPTDPTEGENEEEKPENKLGNFVEDLNLTINNGILIGFKEGITYDDVKMEISSKNGNYEVIIVDSSNVEISNETLISTNQTILIKDINGDNSYKIVIKGDVNGDGNISSLDYVMIKNHIMETSVITDEAQLKAADYSLDGSISSADYVCIKNYIMEK